MKNFYIEGGIKGDYIVGISSDGNHQTSAARASAFRTTSTWTQDAEDDFKKSWLKQTSDTDFIFSGRAEYCWKYSFRRKKVLMDKYKEQMLLRNRIIISLLFSPFILVAAWAVMAQCISGFFAGVGLGYCLYRLFSALTEKWPIENINQIKDRVK